MRMPVPVPVIVAMPVAAVVIMAIMIIVVPMVVGGAVFWSGGRWTVVITGSVHVVIILASRLPWRLAAD